MSPLTMWTVSTLLSSSQLLSSSSLTARQQLKVCHWIFLNVFILCEKIQRSKGPSLILTPVKGMPLNCFNVAGTQNATYCVPLE